MSTTLTGPEAVHVGFTVKSRLRDYLKANLGNRNAVDVVLVQELEDEVPTSGPIISIRTSERERKRLGSGWQHNFVLDIRVMANVDTGGVMSGPNDPPITETLSDEMDELLTRADSVSALAALGINNLWLGKRTETSEKGLHTNRHSVGCQVDAAP